MVSPLAGISGVVKATFGETVTIRPREGVEFNVAGVYREVPVEILDDMGGMASEQCTLRVSRPDASLITGKDTVVIADGRAFQVQRRAPGGSNAPDGFVTLHLVNQTT